MSTVFSKELKEVWIAVIQEAWSMTGNTSTGNDSDTSLREVEGAYSESAENDTPLKDDDILKIHLQNYREKLSVYKPKISAVIDQPNFQPVSFLQLGLEKSYTVCRISRYYSKDTLEKLFKNLKQKAKEKKLDELLEQSPSWNPSEELKSTFLITNNLFDKFFNPTTQSRIKRTFVASIECLEEHIDEILKLNPLPIGTGFLVGNSHLLTNHHVIPTPEMAQQCIAQFGYEDEPTKLVKTLDYEFDSKLLFVTNPQLDYTLVQLQTDTYTKRPAGYDFGWLDLIESEENIAPKLDKAQVEMLIERLNNDDYNYRPEKLESYGLSKGKDLEGDRVAIIQHPRGRKKEIVLQNNEVTRLSHDNLDYKADTDYGSSGSPVFNMNWKLVALTKRVIPKQNGKNNQQHSQLNNANKSDAPFSWDASQGTRICRIVEDLKIKSFTNPKLQSFIQDFVFTSEQLNFPPLPSGLEFDGNSSYVDLNVDKGLDNIDEITVEVWVQRHCDSGYGIIIHQPNAYRLSWSVGKLFLELNLDTEQNSRIQTERQCLNDGLWHHVALTYNSKTKKNPTIYVDGEKQLLIFDSQGSNFLKNIIYDEDNLSKVYIGCRKKNNNYDYYFQGSISEIRYWKLACDEEQIKQNMNRRLDVTKEKKLLGYWRFEEGKGCKVYNLASKSSAATKQPEIDSIHDTGLEFNGFSDYIDCGNNKKIKFDKAITIESWFNLNEENQLGFVINQGGSWSQPGYSLWFYRKNNIRVELCDDEKNQIIFYIEHDCNKNSWHHMAFTWSMALDSTQSFQMYIDGKKKEIVKTSLETPKSSPKTLKPTIHGNVYQILEPCFKNGIGKPKVNLNIGRAEKYTCYFNGSIAEVRLWDIARTEQEIKENMNCRLDAEEKGLVGYWKLEEEEGDKAKDSRNNAMNGNVYGGKWLKPYSLMQQDVFGVAFKTKRLTACQYPALPLTWGLKFNNKKYYDCGAADKFNTSKAITIEAWVKQTFGDCLIVNCVNGNGDSLQDSYSLSWYEGKIRVILSDGNPQNKTIVYSKNVPSDNMWHHIAFTWSLEPEGEIAIYIDGRYQDCIVEGKSNALIIQGRSKMTGLFTDELKNLKTNLTIGERINNEKDTYRDFEIAEVRLWNVARTQQQIQANMYRRLNSQSFQLNSETKGLVEEQNDLVGLVGYWRLDEANAQDFLK